MYALCSYFFLDSRLLLVNTTGLFFPLAVTFMLIGLLRAVFSMPFLGRRSFVTEVGGLRTSGLYRYGRNPQLVGGFFFIVGYALLWPSWQAISWASLWLVIAHWMVQCEEPHLEKVFGDDYRAYCARTPRTLDCPRNDLLKCVYGLTLQRS